MNGMLIQLVASGAALSLMGGAVTIHYVNVQKVASNSWSEESAGHLELASLETRHELLPFQPAARVVEDKSVARASEKDMTLDLLQGMVDQIESLSRENRQLREEHSVLAEQVAEANRDLSQLQFRVDTHSESFRPLRISEDSALRPYNSSSSAHPVLPPKDWTESRSSAGWRTGGQ